MEIKGQATCLARCLGFSWGNVLVVCVCVWSCVCMHICHRNVSKVEWKILGRLMWWIHGCDNSSPPAACAAMTPAGCIDKEGRGQITYTPGKKTQTYTCTQILCGAISAHFCVSHLFPSPFTTSVLLFLNQHRLLSLFHLLQVTVWSPHLSGWRVMEVSRGALFQPDLYLSPTLKMRTPWSRWQNTSLLGCVRPCVPTATWSSGDHQLRILYNDHCTSVTLGSNLNYGGVVNEESMGSYIRKEGGCHGKTVYMNAV